MALFRFKAIDAKGKTVSGESGAENVDELTRILEKQGLFLMEGNPVLRDAAGAAPASTSAPRVRRMRVITMLRTSGPRYGMPSWKEWTTFVWSGSESQLLM